MANAGMIVSTPYEDLVRQWIAAHIPHALLQIGPFDVYLWQWVALPIVAVLAWVIGYMGGHILLRTLNRIVAKTETLWDDVILKRVRGPLTLACTLIVAAALVSSLALEGDPRQLLFRLIHAGFLLAVFWALWRAIDIASQMLSYTQWARESAASRSLLPLGVRAAKIVLFALAIVATLSTMGYPAASVIAGLGIGGLAVALAAQKTVENLFGAFSLGVDQPFCEGDFVKIEDFVGTVEAIGLRSTRIRTLDRTIVTMPNGKLADMRLESFAARDRLRLSTVLGVTYDTTATQMREVLAGLEQVLRQHPKIWPDAVIVKFREFSASSLDIDVMAWFQTSDWSEFLTIRQDVLLQFMDVVEKAGASFAFPTRTVHLATAVPQTMLTSSP